MFIFVLMKHIKSFQDIKNREKMKKKLMSINDDYRVSLYIALNTSNVKIWSPIKSQYDEHSQVIKSLAYKFLGWGKTTGTDRGTLFDSFSLCLFSYLLIFFVIFLYSRICIFFVFYILITFFSFCLSPIVFYCQRLIYKHIMWRGSGLATT